MPAVTFLFSNPRHHLAMMAPVARALAARGVGVRLLSLAELRGFRTPRLPDLEVSPLIPVALRSTPSSGASLVASEPRRGLVRDLAAAALVPLVRYRARRTRVLVVPNDAAFPYDRILAARVAHEHVLLQEGIRFGMPVGDRYGTGALAAICAWGEGTKAELVARGVPAARIVVTGSPRHDDIEVAAWRERGRALEERCGPFLSLITNPIETQGFGTAADKRVLVERFIAGAAGTLRARGLKVLVKCHAFEDPRGYREVFHRLQAEDLLLMDDAIPLYAALAGARGAVVMTSTAGLEGLLFDTPIAALPLPTGTFGFEYVSSGAAVPLALDDLAGGLAELLDRPAARAAARAALVQRHLHARGEATRNVAEVLLRLV